MKKATEAMPPKMYFPVQFDFGAKITLLWLEAPSLAAAKSHWRKVKHLFNDFSPNEVRIHFGNEGGAR